jgi:hypothetical protein
MRLFPEDEPFAYAEALYENASVGVGVRLAAMMSGSVLELELEGVDATSGPLDILADGELLTRHPVIGRTRLEVPLPRNRSEIEVWLPHRGTVRVGAVRAVGGADVEPVSARRRRWITYGSSITQCAASEGPSVTWPALVAREMDWDLTCMGFGANCHLDPSVVRAIGRLDADVVSMCLGINIFGRAGFSARSLPGQIAELVRRVRESHPNADIVLGSPIFCAKRETARNAVGLSLRDIRETVHRVGSDFRERGDTRIHVLDGLSVLGEHEAHLLHDGLHPGPEGYRLMATRISRYLRHDLLAQATDGGSI